MQGRLIFRAEANSTIGRGHISRCIAIAGMFKNDIEVLFVVLKNNEDFIKNIVKDYRFIAINKKDDFIELLRKEDVLWIDGYHFTENWKKQIRPLVKKLIETNDIPYKVENVDIVFNHTPGLTKDQFVGANKKTALYLGLEYALLRQKFLKKAMDLLPKTTGNGVFICFGGADTYNLGENFVKVLMQNNFNNPIYWVTNGNNQYKTTYNTKNIKVLSNLNEDEMIHYMSKAKVVLIPSSVLSFEAMALRKPIFTCYFVDNQKLIHQGLVEEGLVQGVGYVETRKDVENSIVNFLKYYDNTNIHIEQIKKQQKLLDGKSGSRIKDSILSV